MFVFEERGKPEYSIPGEQCLGAKDKNQRHKLNPHTMYSANPGIEHWATLMGGKCSHHCTILAP